MLSAEISAKWGRTTLSAHGCCVDAGYWLGTDGMRYLAPVFGMSGWDYADLKSRASLHLYGTRLNVNLLGFSESTRQGRWTLEVSPAVYAVGTKAALCTIADGCDVLEYDTEWHFGYGARLQAGYAITRNLSAGIYTEFTALTGSRLDGITEIRHDDNFIWESGVRIGWNFGKSGRKKASASSSVSAVAPVIPGMCVTLVGRCDRYGSTGINRYISQKRAEAVKTWLVDSGIDAARITAVGNGSDMEADSNMKARRVDMERQ